MERENGGAQWVAGRLLQADWKGFEDFLCDLYTRQPCKASHAGELAVAELAVALVLTTGALRRAAAAKHLHSIQLLSSDFVWVVPHALAPSAPTSRR